MQKIGLLVLYPLAMESMSPTCGNETNLSPPPSLVTATTVWYQSTKYYFVAINDVIKRNKNIY